MALIILSSAGSMSTSATAAGRLRRRRTSSSLPLWLILIVFFLLQTSCNFGRCLGDNRGHCPRSSSCGNIQNIHTPFRLDTDPPNCAFSSFVGDKSFTLYCHSNSSLFLYLSNSSLFLVKGINYDNFTIHLVDPGVQQGNCSSLPISPISLSYTPYYTYIWRYPPTNAIYLSRAALLISCDRKQVYHNNSYFVEITAPCKHKTRKYSYVIVGDYYVRLEQAMESCSIDMITLLPVTVTNDKATPYQEIHTQFSHGFHLSWFRVLCQPNCSNYGICYLDEANRPTCLLNDFPPINICDRIRAWFLFISRPHLYLPPRWYWGPIFKITVWLKIILNSLVALRGVLFLFGTLCIFVFLIYRWRRRHLSLYDAIEEFLQNHNDLTPIRYSYKDVKKITSHFKDKLGEGGYGCVYGGKLRSGRLAAVKVLGKSSKRTNGEDFMNEVATIGRIHHVNVVQLIGYCADQSKRALVYDFMPNGSLDKYIFAKEGCVSLSWDKLFEISLGVARGIEYLHRGCDMQILHFDIKPHNILLDENFIPKVSDFGLTKLYPATKDTIASLTAVRGTIGYMAPELFYKNIGRVSYKADVYSFGMLLLEIAGKRKNLNALVEKSSQIYFPSWIYDQISTGDDIKIGENVTGEEVKTVKKMIIVGLWCIQMNPNNRPSMNKVVEMLEGDMKHLELPPKPSLCPDEMPNVVEICESSYLSDDSIE